MSGVANLSPAPALTALNNFNALNWKKLIACVISAVKWLKNVIALITVMDLINHY